MEMAELSTLWHSQCVRLLPILRPERVKGKVLACAPLDSLPGEGRRCRPARYGSQHQSVVREPEVAFDVHSRYRGENG
jgi:hypothetical protein